jgi:tetratricopeptide (TPR) repeat protein
MGTGPFERGAGLLGLLALGMLSMSGAYAASFDEDLGKLDAKTEEIAARVVTLEFETRPGAYLTNAEAVSRFQDYLFLHLIGEHQPAAEGFFALVTTGVLADAGLHRDAEWYLAEALVGLQNYKTAASRFQAIVDDPAHPFRDDGVRRLLELYAISGDKESFSKLYDAEIASGRVQPTGLITYSLAKSFYQQKDYAQAEQFFGQVTAENPWYGRARYFLGTIQVIRGNLDAAKTEFQTVSDLSIQTTEDRLVHDLALLALGRISYHTEDYFNASEFYNRIGGDSRYQPDKLYEIIWTSIRRERWRDALNNVEIFLLAYPEHEYSAQLRLLQGHLNFQERAWNDALGAYEQVISEYGPVQARFAALAQPGSSADVAVREVLETQSGSTDLPAYAVAMMRSDPELSRAIGVFRNLESERLDIEASERIISELRAFIDGAGSIGSYERARTDALTMSQSALETRLALLEVEERWLDSLGEVAVNAKLTELANARRALLSRVEPLAGSVATAAKELSTYERSMGEVHAEADNARREAGDRERRIEVLRTELSSIAGLDEATRQAKLAEIDKLGAEVAQFRALEADADQRMAQLRAPSAAVTVNVAEMTTLYAEVASLSQQFIDVRPKRPGLVIADRADADHRMLDDAFARLTGVYESVLRNEGVEVSGIRKRFEEEVVAVAAERTDYEALLGDARTVSLEITRQGFGRLEDFFADSILKADMGIVDVFWAQKLEITDELTRIQDERQAQLDDLAQRFKLIREKMGEPQ